MRVQRTQRRKESNTKAYGGGGNPRFARSSSPELGLCCGAKFSIRHIYITQCFTAHNISGVSQEHTQTGIWRHE
jgi:hypothetical protein